ncbi:hypothetical protein BTVI_65885 [Pitangus sulphuratus]|nr:hypothetical protein BTVI_65885 [Pitangus sulphuratus]
MDDRPRRSQYSELEDHDCQNDQLPLDPELVQDLMLQLDPYKPMEPDGIHPRILQELPDVISKPISMSFEQSWESGELQSDWKLPNIVLFSQKGKKEGPGNYRPVSLTSVPGNPPSYQGKSVDVIFLDFSKAFNTVSDSILLDKMCSPQLDKHIMW